MNTHIEIPKPVKGAALYFPAISTGETAVSVWMRDTDGNMVRIKRCKDLEAAERAAASFQRKENAAVLKSQP
jgi:hypothetical protein